MTEQTVRKAGRQRLLTDFRRAAWLVQDALDLYWHENSAAHAYVRGAIAAESSLTVQASLLTAWGD